MRTLDSSKNGDAVSPDWDSFHLKIFLQKSLCLIPVVRSQYGTTPEAAESLKAQINSQSKLTTTNRKNRKFEHENEALKENEHAPQGV
jgi:hypothetical protein